MTSMAAAGRLTAELITKSPQYMSCTDDYTLGLRAHKLAVIENLGATENQFDCIDLTDNDITRLDGFPTLRKVKALLISNNRVRRITPNLAERLPNLETLILTNNCLADVSELTPLAACKHLTVLSLLGNPVSEVAQYRLHVVRLLPQLKSLDFTRVKSGERKLAAGVGEPGVGPSSAQARGGGADASDNSEMAKRRAELKIAIANATSLDEVTKLEEELLALQSG